ncbi:hypothetical protein EDC04DRAFT_881727 [Pisolithus marmoratus]|nr:hypothetical protein EDC04DRAFT_881727 [Pisolithus marmoratus]
MENYTTSYLGPLLVSLVLSAILYGCALVQTYVYYKLFAKDSWKFKCLVASEMFLQTAYLAFLILGLWYTVFTDYTQHPPIFGLVITSVSIVFSGPIALCTQAFFVFRLYTFSQQKVLPIFCSLLIVTQFVFTMVVTIAAAVAAWGLPPQPWRHFIISTLFITICTDTTIAMSMSYYLKARELGIRRTARVVDRMVLYIMATGIITSISALASGLSFIITPDNITWLGLLIIDSGLYTNSLLAALNARAKFSHELHSYPESADDSEVPLHRLDIQ